jgi:hypothetical protein
MPVIRRRLPEEVQPEQQVLPYSFDLKAAAQYGVWALRKAITSGELPVVSPKPYLIHRRDLEAFGDSRVKRVNR